MSYKVIQIEGIGPVYAEKLNALGITTTDELLARGATRKGRKELAEQIDILPEYVLTWVNHADLFRIKGVAGQFAELLEAAGVDTVKELKHRVPENLHAAMVEVNEKKHICGYVPEVKEIAAMIDQAKELPAVMEY